MTPLLGCPSLLQVRKLERQHALWQEQQQQRQQGQADAAGEAREAGEVKAEPAEGAAAAGAAAPEPDAGAGTVAGPAKMEVDASEPVAGDGAAAGAGAAVSGGHSVDSMEVDAPADGAMQPRSAAAGEAGEGRAPEPAPLTEAQRLQQELLQVRLVLL